FAYPFFLPPSFAFPSLRMASGHSTDKFSFLYPTDTSQNVKSKNRLSSTMNPVYSPVQPGTPYGNPKNMAYTGYPGGYPTTAPTYTANLYQTGSPGYPPGVYTHSHTCFLSTEHGVLHTYISKEIHEAKHFNDPLTPIKHMHL
ncbi:hypothetical protein cypCar_00028362, partial [Cyprinus carpio]